MSGLRFLLDEHISPAVAIGLRRQCPKAVVDSVLLWEEGALAGSTDALLLDRAFAQKRVLVTYDLSTIAPLLKEWAEQRIDHGGIVFIDERTIPPNDFVGIIRGLAQLWTETKSRDWTNQMAYLTKRQSSK